MAAEYSAGMPISNLHYRKPTHEYNLKTNGIVLAMTADMKFFGFVELQYFLDLRAIQNKSKILTFKKFVRSHSVSSFQCKDNTIYDCHISSFTFQSVPKYHYCAFTPIIVQRYSEFKHVIRLIYSFVLALKFRI